MKELIAKLKNMEMQYNKDLNNLKAILFQKGEETDKLIEKYENKIILVKFS